MKGFKNTICNDEGVNNTIEDTKKIEHNINRGGYRQLLREAKRVCLVKFFSLSTFLVFGQCNRPTVWVLKFEPIPQPICHVGIWKLKGANRDKKFRFEPVDLPDLKQGNNSRRSQC